MLHDVNAPLAEYRTGGSRWGYEIKSNCRLIRFGFKEFAPEAENLVCVDAAETDLIRLARMLL